MPVNHRMKPGGAVTRPPGRRRCVDDVDHHRAHVVAGAPLVGGGDQRVDGALGIRLGSEQPGDLGKAAHGFEEAMALADEADLARDAERSLSQVRTEIGRRRAREGNAVEIEQRRPAWRALSLLLSENAWSGLAIASSLILGAGLFFRWKSPTGRRRGASTTMIAVAVPAMLFSAALAATARHGGL